nr:MAG TPA: Protein of unknown function (DUF2547) [Inoviridae sp.]
MLRVWIPVHTCELSILFWSDLLLLTVFIFF